jgi:hypothetical protein
MPLDSFFDYRKERIDWNIHFCLWPKKSVMSGKRIWFECGYRGVVMITGPGEPVFITRWLTKEEFLMSRLRGII